jgi:hypothetical protein
MCDGLLDAFSAARRRLGSSCSHRSEGQAALRVSILDVDGLRRTLGIAIVVGVLLTVINEDGVIAAGHATTATWVRCGLNFLVPFLVSNAGLLSGRR